MYILLLYLYTACYSHRDNDGMTPLHLATMHNNVEIVKFLCAKASNLDILSFSGFTALQLAAMKNHIDCIKVSISAVLYFAVL